MPSAGCRSLGLTPKSRFQDWDRKWTESPEGPSPACEENSPRGNPAVHCFGAGRRRFQTSVVLAARQRAALRRRCIRLPAIAAGRSCGEGAPGLRRGGAGQAGRRRAQPGCSVAASSNIESRCAIARRLRVRAHRDEAQRGGIDAMAQAAAISWTVVETWPRWLSPCFERTSVRIMPWKIPRFSITCSSTTRAW